MTKILYVEDNEDNIYMLKWRLERNNYEVIIAKNGQEGIDTTIRQQPDIILMDVGLPIIDGFEATRILKQNTSTKSIPIIMLTAHATVEDSKKSFTVGADDYETKPVNMPGLIKKIINLLNKNGK